MKRIALLLDSAENEYQKLLAESAIRRIDHHGFTLVGPSFAEGSSFTQLDQILTLTREGDRVDALVLSVCSGASDLPSAKRVCRLGVSMVYLNRIPEHVGELRQSFPDVLVSGVAPDQEGIGRIQAAQCARLAPLGGFVLLVTGVRSSPSTQGRERGFRQGLNGRFECHSIDGRWTAAGAERALSDWLRLGADRDKPLAAVVCQNDQMARGVRAVLARQAPSDNAPALLDVPLLGCDGLASEGLRMVREGEIAATVVVPPTSGPAVDRLEAFWRSGEKPELTVLAPESFPAMSEIGPRKR